MRSSLVTWTLPFEKLVEVAEKTDSLLKSAGPCHHYVDIDAPTATLVLSKDEYV